MIPRSSVTRWPGFRHIAATRWWPTWTKSASLTRLGSPCWPGSGIPVPWPVHRTREHGITPVPGNETTGVAMDGSDHYRKAEELAAKAEEHVGQGDGQDSAAVWAAVAQVHATLALATAAETVRTRPDYHT